MNIQQFSSKGLFAIEFALNTSTSKKTGNDLLFNVYITIIPALNSTTNKFGTKLDTRRKLQFKLSDSEIFKIYYLLKEPVENSVNIIREGKKVSIIKRVNDNTKQEKVNVSDDFDYVLFASVSSKEQDINITMKLDYPLVKYMYCANIDTLYLAHLQAKLAEIKQVVLEQRRFKSGT